MASHADAWSHLGEELCQLRVNAGMSGRQLGAKIGCDQSRISRIESGRARITQNEVGRWLVVTDASSRVQAEVDRLIKLAEFEPTAGRQGRPHGWKARRTDLEAVELEASSILLWRNSFVPELLQSAAYARHLLRSTPGRTSQHLAVRISKLIDRQAILYVSSSPLEVVISEHVLRQQFGGRAVMVDQLNRIAALTRQKLIHLSVIPANTEFATDFALDVDIYLGPSELSDNLATVEGGLIANQSSVQRHIDQFRAYQRHSWRGDQAIEFVEDLAREMSSGRSGVSDADGECDGA